MGHGEGTREQGPEMVVIRKATGGFRSLCGLPEEATGRRDNRDWSWS